MQNEPKFAFDFSFGIAEAIALLGIALVVAGYFQAKRILRAHIFAEYTRRFSEIEAEFRMALAAEQSNQNAEYSNSVALQISVRKYLNLCSEEYHLRRKGLIDDEVWSYWKRGMAAILNTSEFRVIVDPVIQEYEIIYPRFHRFLASLRPIEITEDDGKE
ncbi:MAG: hypothetical protein AAGD04_13190 [Pseudomonadota bacterium]